MSYVKVDCSHLNPDKKRLKQWVLKHTEGIPMETLQCVTTAFPLQLLSVMNDMVVTYKVSYLKSNDTKTFSWVWNAPNSVNKMECPQQCQ